MGNIQVEDKKDLQHDNSTKGKENHLEKYNFQKGVSGNPKGRPIGSKNKKTIFQEVMLAKGIKEQDPMRYLFGILADIITDKANNPAVIKATVVELMDRIDGKVPAKVEYSKTRAELDEAAGNLVEIFSDAEDVDVIENDNDIGEPTTNDL